MSPLLVLLALGASETAAQPLGTFTWQLQPHCNRVTVNVRQDGAVYTLDGFDDQCGGGQRAPLTGLATPNPDGSIGFGLNIVLPSGQAGTVEARVAAPSLTGTWRDSGGGTGTFCVRAQHRRSAAAGSDARRRRHYRGAGRHRVARRRAGW